MTSGLFPRLRLLGAVSLFCFAAPAVMAQSAPEGQSQTPPAAKTGETKPGSQKPSAGTIKIPAGGYATEGEARSKCGSGVVWVGDDHFNHYPGSREYGRKPGYFTCG